MFGLEIRKGGSIRNIYRDVDIILSNNGIPQGGVNQEVQLNTIAHTLHKLLQPGATFYQCDIRKCAEIAGIHIPHERMQIYNSIHCMKWAEMTPEYRQQVMAMVLDDFRSVLNPQQ